MKKRPEKKLQIKLAPQATITTSQNSFLMLGDTYQKREKGLGAYMVINAMVPLKSRDSKYQLVKLLMWGLFHIEIHTMTILEVGHIAEKSLSERCQLVQVYLSRCCHHCFSVICTNFVLKILMCIKLASKI